MTPGSQEGSPRVEVVHATPEQEPIVANLLELYAYDFSEFHPMQPGPDGRFGYKGLSRYWLETDRLPLLLKADGRLAGVVLVKRERGVLGTETVWDVAEFFVLRMFRRQGVGKAAAHEIWRRYPGKWQVRVMESNYSGYRFWEHTIRDFVGDELRMARFEKGGQPWNLITFQAVRAGERRKAGPAGR
jgi:predicted acetyltransferase